MVKPVLAHLDTLTARRPIWPYSQAVFQDFGLWEETGGPGESADWHGKKIILKIPPLGCHVIHKPANNKCCTKGHLNVIFSYI